MNGMGAAQCNCFRCECRLSHMVCRRSHINPSASEIVINTRQSSGELVFEAMRFVDRNKNISTRQRHKYFVDSRRQVRLTNSRVDSDLVSPGFRTTESSRSVPTFFGSSRPFHRVPATDQFGMTQS
jgi:hypothetical protein